MSINVLGTPLETCNTNPMTGYTREGSCLEIEGDVGRHVICVRVTAEFLMFSKAVGNDLSTPMPMFDFPGLKPGDRWCLCALRWKEALDHGMAPPVILMATHHSALEVVTLEELLTHSYHEEQN